MAPSSGHLLVRRILKFAIDKTSSAIRSKLPQTSSTSSSNAVLQPIRLSTQTDPLHPLARIRQSRASQSRWFSTSVRNQADHGSRARAQKNTFNVTKVGKAIRQRGGAPFASILRPNLTGGALPRTAGGYCLGGTGRGVRHFSQAPSCQAQVIQNVNAGIRAFFVGGGKARYDGADPSTGAKRFRSVTKTEDQVLNNLDKHISGVAKGTNLEFQLSPRITALLPSTSETLGSENILDVLSVDFARALKDLSLTLSDLRRLSALGSLPLTLTTTSKGPVLSVRFPGCDAETVIRLCEELGVFQGIVREDECWEHEKDVEMALLFPFAPTTSAQHEGSEYFEHPHQATVDTVIAPEQVEWQGMLSPSLTSDFSGKSYEHVLPIFHDEAGSRSQSGYESMRESDFADDDPYVRYHPHASAGRKSGAVSEDYEGLEGIYRFLRECDAAERR